MDYVHRLLISSPPMSRLANSTEAFECISIVWLGRVLVAISGVQHGCILKFYRNSEIADPLHCTFIPAGDEPVLRDFLSVIGNRIAALENTD